MVFKELEEKKFHKLIIGAALKDFNLIERLSYIYTKAGAHAIDISAFPNSVIYAQKGISRALNEGIEKSPSLMVSVNVDQDPHFRRIEINWQNCTECLACVPTCPSQAFSAEKFTYNEDLCFGCSACLPACDFSALDFVNWSAFDVSSLQSLKELGANAIEIHIGSALPKFAQWYEQLPKDLFQLESFCIGSEQMTMEELLESVDIIVDSFYKKYPLERKFIIQIDGLPMSGASSSAKLAKDQVSINNAKIVQQHIKEKHSSLQENIFLQLAGGITEKTFTKASQQELDINGLAIGSYLRKKIVDCDELDAVELVEELIELSLQ